MTWQLPLDPMVSGRLCLTLVHSLWLFALLATLSRLIDHLWLKRNAQRSYTVHVTALLLGLVALPLAFVVVEIAEEPPLITSIQPPDLVAAPPPAAVKSAQQLARVPDHVSQDAPGGLAPTTIDEPFAVESPTAAAEESLPGWLRWTPWLTALYVVGVLSMLLRLATDAARAERLRLRATPVANGPLKTALEALSRQWNVRVVPVVATVDRIIVPRVIGFVRPTILLPASALSGLSVAELEMILAHELAHVRRYDMWVNLLQRLAEAGLFFNPALWYLSRRISTLREYCCDELTCQSAGSADPAHCLQYATALLKVVQLARPHLAARENLASVAASGRSPSELRCRVARMFGEPLREPMRLSRGGLWALAATILLLASGPALLQSQSPAGESADNAEPFPPPTAADEAVADARRRTFGVDALPTFHLRGTYWNAPVVGMQKLADRSLENLWKSREGDIDPNERHGSKIALAWDMPRLVVRSESGLVESSYVDCRYWDGSDGWWVGLAENSRTFARYSDIAQASESFGTMYFPQLTAAGNRLPWPGPHIAIEHENDPALTRYEKTGTETIDGVLCNVYDGPARHERLWIEQSTGLVKAHYRTLVHRGRPDYYTDLIRAVAGRTFTDAKEYRAWQEQQPAVMQAKLLAHWAAAHWPLSEPGSLVVFSDYRELTPSVRWPMRCERLLVHYDGRTAADGFNYIRSEIELEPIDDNESWDTLIADATPKEGDKVYDRRFDPEVIYEWPQEPDQVQQLAVHALRERQEEDAATREIENTPINSVPDAIKILTEGPNTDPAKVWARAIKYLVDHKDEALPEVIKHLDGEQRDHPISKLAFALRAIGDRRAVPALIRALPRTLLPSRSDYGLILYDAGLCRFMQEHDLNSSRDSDGNSFDYGRAFREVIGSLHRLAGQDFDDMQLNWIQLADTESQRAQQRKLFREQAEKWADWWEVEWQSLVDDPQYAKVNLQPFEAERPATAGRNRPPAGNGVTLDEGRSGWIVQSAHESTQQCFVDLDTRREAGWPESLQPVDQIGLDSPQLLAWAREQGFDMVGVTHTPPGETQPLYCLKPIDMRVWRITKDEHRNLDRALTGEEEYPLSRPVDLMVPPREVKPPYDHDYDGAAFLYVTREGTAGLIRMTAQVTDTNPPSGQVYSVDDQFSPRGYYRGVKIGFAAMTEPTAPGDGKQASTEPVQPARKSTVPTNPFVVCPVTTDLQRRLLGGMDSTALAASVCVFVDAEAFPVEGEIDEKAQHITELVQSLFEYSINDDREIWFRLLDHGEEKSFEKRSARLDKLQELITKLGKETGFASVRVSRTFGGGFVDGERLTFTKFIERARSQADDTDDESAIKETEALRVTPVQTFLSHLLANADCVVEFQSVVRDADGVRFKTDVLPGVTAALRGLKSVGGENLLLKIRYSRTMKPEIEAWINDIPGRRAYAKELGFELCNVSMSQIAEEEELEPETDTHPITVSGRALNESGGPVAGARIFLAATDHELLAETLTDDSGAYRFANIPLPIERADTNTGRDQGTFEVFGIAEGYALTWRTRKTLYPDRTVVNNTNPSASAGEQKTGYGTEESIELDLTFGAPTTLRGRVVDDRGEPLANTTVSIGYCDIQWDKSRYNQMSYVGSLIALNGRGIVPDSVKWRTTDEHGRFEFASLPADYRWQLGIRPPGHSSRRVWAVTRELKQTEIDGTRVYSGDFEVVFPRPRQVTFRVLYGDTGAPAQGVGVGGGFWETTDQDGIVRAPMTDGEHKVSMTQRIGTPYLRSSEEVVISEGSAAEPITLKLDPAAVVDITVLDADTGEPLEGVDVWWDEPIEGQGGNTYRTVRGYRSWEVETRISHYEQPCSDEQGKMRVLFPPGKHRIGVGREAFPEGYQPVDANGKEIDCQPGEPVQVVFAMRKPQPKSAVKDKTPTGPVLRGRITDEEGNPVPDVQVVLYGGLATRFRGQEATTDAQGHYVFSPLKTGAMMFPDDGSAEWYTGVQLKHDAYVPADGQSWRDIHIPTSPEHEEILNLTMTRGGNVSGQVIDDETGQAVAELDLRIHDGPVTGNDGSNFLVYVTTDAEGRFTSEPLFPGRYVIDINDNDFKGRGYPKIGLVTIEAGRTTELDMTTAERADMQDPFKITGTAIGDDGQSMVYGGVGIRMVGDGNTLRTSGGGIDGRNVFGLRFGPIERSEPTEASPYGVGTHDVEIFGNNSRYGYKLVSRTPAEPLRITDDPTKPELEDGIRYIRPNEPVEFQLVYAKDDNVPRQFMLNVVGPDGEPVAGAEVEFRTRPVPTAEQIHWGEFVRMGPYGTFAKTDDRGRVAVTLPRRPGSFNVSIKTPGYGPYWAGWQSSSHPDVPLEFTAELEAGWSVGGVVVDPDGNPIAGVEVDPNVYFKKRPGDTDQLGVGTRIRTDDQGRWRFDNVPASMSDVHVSFNHSDYQSLRQSLSQGVYGLALDATPSEPIQLERGLTIRGTVTDEQGKPIHGALVRTKFLNDIREATTDAEGRYELVGCEPRMTRVVASASGRAMELQEVRVDPDMEPVNFTLKPGGHVRVRVVDEQGKGIARARIFFQRWRGHIDYFEFDHVHEYTDENGVWEWNEAPLDEFQADICRPDGMQLEYQPLVAREEEYVFTPPPPLVVSGSVVDANTKQPITKFRVIPGLRDSTPLPRLHWMTEEAYEATNGTYQIRFERDHEAHLVRIEAPGYKVAISRDIKADEGKVDIDFDLQPAENIAAAIVTADGKPAARARVALGVAGSQINIEAGDIDDGSTYATRLDADDAGRFSIPARDEPFQLVITHPAGFAHLKSSEGPIPDRIVLTPWARVEGTFRVGAEPAPNIVLSLYGGIQSFGSGEPRIFTSHDVTTGADGRFVFERVFPGQGRIGRRILLMVDDGATEVTSSQRISAEFVAGETTRLDIGGTGRPVVGKLAPPAGHTEKVLWNFALVTVEADLPQPKSPDPPEDVRGDQEKYRAWWSEWRQTAEGQTWAAAYKKYQTQRDQSPYITASIDRDGSFRIDDMPAGEWVLSVRFDRNPPGTLTEYRFTVPPIPGGRSSDPLDLGTLRLITESGR